jgi:hypothetical protein
MRLPKTLTLATTLTALAVAGCGGGGDETTATTAKAVVPAPLSKTDLIAQGDAICGEVNAAVGALGSSESASSEQAIQAAELYAGMIERIKGLGTPDDEAGYAEFIAAADQLAKVEGELKLAAEREEEASVSATPALEEFQTVAGEYGFQNCSEGPGAPIASGAGGAEEAPEAEEGGVEVAPEEVEEEVVPEEVAPEEVAPETGGAGGGVEEAAPETGGGTGGGSSGGVGPG